MKWLNTATMPLIRGDVDSDQYIVCCVKIANFHGDRDTRGN